MLQSIAIILIIAGLASSFGVAVSQQGSLSFPVSTHSVSIKSAVFDERPTKILKISSLPEEPTGEIDFSNLRGVNFMDPVLTREQRFPAFESTQNQHVKTYVPKLKDLGFNLIRVPVDWEAYELSPEIFLDQLELIASQAQKSGIYMWLDFHHYDATSYWRSSACTECGDYNDYGKGFPRSVVQNYHPSTDYAHDSEVEAFWLDYYANDVRGVNNVWQKQADVMKVMIARIDKYDNVIGYEILNEPHFFNEANYAQLGKLHTFIGKEIREVTDKAIIFTRETAHHGFNRQPDMEYLILPQVSGQLIYTPHIYNIDNADEHIAKWKQYQHKWKQMGYEVGLGVGEWAMQPPQTLNPTQDLSDETIGKFKDNGMFWTYWSYGGFMQDEGNVIMERDGTLTEVGKYVTNSVEELY